jgi:hypothetical protein
MSDPDHGELFLCAVELATKMARSLGEPPCEVVKRQRSRSWILGYLKKQHTGIPVETLRALVESLQRAKLSAEIPELLPGERHRGVREDSYEENSDPIWAQRADRLAQVSAIPRSMFELCLLAKRIWDWPTTLTENVVEVAERLELINYQAPNWRRTEEQDVKQPKQQRTRETNTIRKLPFKLSDGELVKLVQSRQSLIEERAAAEVELVRVMREHKAKIGELTRALEYNDQTVRHGHELKPVECRVIQDLDAGRVRVVRLDTGACIEERELTERESQLTLEDVTA